MRQALDNLSPGVKRTKIGFGGLWALNEPVPQTVKFALSDGQKHALTLSQSGQTPFAVAL